MVMSLFKCQKMFFFGRPLGNQLPIKKPVQRLYTGFASGNQWNFLPLNRYTFLQDIWRGRTGGNNKRPFTRSDLSAELADRRNLRIRHALLTSPTGNFPWVNSQNT